MAQITLGKNEGIESVLVDLSEKFLKQEFFHTSSNIVTLKRQLKNISGRNSLSISSVKDVRATKVAVENFSFYRLKWHHFCYLNGIYPTLGKP